MSAPTQTLSVDRECIAHVLRALGGETSLHTHPGDCPICDRLRVVFDAAFSQPEHQGEEKWCSECGLKLDPGVPPSTWTGHSHVPVPVSQMEKAAISLGMRNLAEEDRRVLDAKTFDRVFTAHGVTEQAAQTYVQLTSPTIPPPPPALSDEERERLEAERNKFAELAGWDFEGDSEQGLVWDFDRIKKQCSEHQHWDGYGGEPPTEEALERLRGFDRALSYVPLFDGGIQVEFHALGLDFEAVIDKNGEAREYDLEPSPPEHLEQPELPEEAGRAIMARWADASQEFHGDEERVAQALAEAAAPSIRKQERERVRKALQKLKIYRPLIDGDPEQCVLVEALEAALDSLEDSDAHA